MIVEKEIMMIELENELVDFFMNYEEEMESVVKSKKGSINHDKLSDQIDRKRNLKRWKNSVGYFSLNPGKLTFSLKDL